LYERVYIESNATRGYSEGYSTVVIQEEAPSSPHCKGVAPGSYVQPDESENSAHGDSGNLQVHITVMCTEIQALQEKS